MKECWNNLKQDPEFVRYFPDNCITHEPPRAFFFTVLSSIRPNLLSQMLNNAERHYLEKQAENACVLEINPAINFELQNITWKYSLFSTKMDKKISFRTRQI